jgi:prephenate dehydratase
MKNSNSIVYQGAPGSFSHLTALHHCRSYPVLDGKKTFLEVFEALQKREAQYGIIPIENSLIGSIYENYDLLGKSSLSIIREIKTRIELSLIALPGASIDQIKTVFSHPKALEQCHIFFQKYPHIQAVIHYDTGGAVEKIKRGEDPSCAAIASSLAAKYYGLNVLKFQLEDDLENYTRFVLLSVEKSSPGFMENHHKCSISFNLEHRKGALVSVLEALSNQGVNLTKIESRPIFGKAFEYFFYLDFQIPLETTTWNAHPLLEDLQQRVKNLHLLGIYECC